MTRWEKLVISIIFAVGVVVVGGIGYAIWFDSTHHCVASHQVWRERDCSRMSCDVNDPLYFIESCTDPHWETVCDVWEKNK
jgi:hypothetical protein